MFSLKFLYVCLFMTSHTYLLRSISESTPLLQMNNSDPLLNSSSTTLNTASTMSHSTSHSAKTLLTPSNFKCISSPSAELQESSSTSEISFAGTPASANSPAQVMTLPSSSLPFTFPSPSLAPLRFSTVDVPLWFQRFHARFRKFQMSDEDLYYELLNCLDDSHLHRVSHLIRHKPPSFAVLKEALLNAFDIPPAQRQLHLSQIPALGDRTPSELLNHLRVTLGKDDSTDETAKLLLLNEFLNRMPQDTRHILRLFQDESLDFIASKADSLLQERPITSSLSSFHAMSYMPGYSFTQPVNPSSYASAQSFTTSQSSASTAPYLTPRYSISTNQMPSNRIHLPRAISQSHVPSGHKPADRTAIINGLCYYHLNYPRNPHFCVAGCKYYNSLSSKGGVSSHSRRPSPSTH